MTAPPTRTGRGVLGLCVFAFTVALSGCSTFGACPAIAWNNTVIVKLEGATRNVSVVEMCVAGVCSVPGPVLQSSDDPVRLETLDPQQLGSYSPAPTSVPLPYPVSRSDDGSWRISTEITSPDEVTLRVLSASGEVLAERDVTLDWVRVGGTEQCGGPAEAGPIIIRLPS
jgi:hypothetical protein